MSRKSAAIVVILALTIASCIPPVGPQPLPSPEAPFEAAIAPNTVLVRYKPSSSKEQRALASDVANGKVTETYSLVPGLEKLIVPDVRAALKSLNQLAYVQYAEPDFRVEPADVIPNDPMFPQLWGLADADAPAAWEMGTGSPDVVVAVIDTGIDYAHPDLAGNIWNNGGETPGNGVDDDDNGYVDDVRGWDFYDGDNDPMGDWYHGTHVAGTIGASGNNAQGVTGVNWTVSLMPLRFMNAQGGFISGAIQALQYAVDNNARISNHSYGSPSWSSALSDAIQSAGARGHLVIAAAGNNARDNDLIPYYPASYDLNNVIAVAAFDPSQQLASFSNFGITSVDLAAPGVSILSTGLNGQYQVASGTSMATPHVAGAAALILSMHPSWSPSQLRSQILSTTRSVAGLLGRVATGGALNIAAATAPSLPGPTATPAAVPTPTFTPTPPPFTSLALNELTVIGRRHGKLADTFARDGNVETIIEKAAPGKPTGRYDALEHIWEFYVPDRSSIRFRVNAWHTLSGDEDAMIFEYSIDRVNYTAMFSVEALAPTDAYQEFMLPASTADDLVYIRVRDTNRAFTSQKAEDSVFVDHMEIVSTAGG